jgi:hypothetical protein
MLALLMRTVCLHHTFTYTHNASSCGVTVVELLSLWPSQLVWSPLSYTLTPLLAAVRSPQALAAAQGQPPH